MNTYGGPGQYWATAGFGADRIKDFDLAKDHVQRDASLWGAVKTAADVIADFVAVIAGKLVLDFGMNQIVFNGLHSADRLESQILIV